MSAQPENEIPVQDDWSGLLAILKGSTLSEYDATYEVVDNSLQYLADQIDIGIDYLTSQILITDNGRGPSRGFDPARMVNMVAAVGDNHERLENSPHPFGRYSWGLKDVIGRFGGRATIEGRNEYGESFGYLCDYYLQIERRRRFVTPKPCELSTHGFQVRFFQVPKELMPRSLEALRIGLARTFKKALRAGINITVNAVEVIPPREATFTKELGFDIELAGRLARIQAGITDDLTRRRNDCEGYDVSCGLRTFIQGYTGDGVFGEFSPAGFFADIELINRPDIHWEINRNKLGFIGADALYAAILKEVTPLLKDIKLEVNRIPVTGISGHPKSTCDENAEGSPGSEGGNETLPPRKPYVRKPSGPGKREKANKIKKARGPRKKTHWLNHGVKGLHHYVTSLPGEARNNYDDIQYAFEVGGEGKSYRVVPKNGRTVCVIWNTDTEEGKRLELNKQFAHAMSAWAAVSWALQHQPESVFIPEKYRRANDENLQGVMSTLLPSIVNDLIKIKVN